MEFLFALISAIGLGILTSISPCPLATNIAAVSFLSKKIHHPRWVFLSGIAYTLGRMMTYAVIGTVIIFSLVGVPTVANFLQKYMNTLLGPILIVVGLFLLDIIKINFSGCTISHQQQNKLAGRGLFGSFALGVVFALSFCPIAAGLFFGSLIPLALGSRFGIIFPFFYGIGTGLPVMVFALGIALGLRSTARWFKQVARAEVYIRKMTGIIFLIVGFYYLWGYALSMLKG